MTFEQLIAAGGPEGLVRQAKSDAAKAAARETRAFWLRVLEQTKLADDISQFKRALYHRYLSELRRRLGIKPTKATIRAQTRERVRRFRARRDA